MVKGRLNPLELHVISHSAQQFDDLSFRWKQAAPWVDYFHLRQKEKTPDEVLQLGRQILKKNVIPSSSFIINQHIEVALKLNCVGVHLPEAVTINQVQKSGLRWGRSVHSIESAKWAEQVGADYVMFGHIFSSASKPGQIPRGLSQLTQIVQAVKIPVIAVGGIHAENVADVAKTGCAGIAIISALLKDDPQVVVQDLKRRWTE
jgi:thiamine-phosphate diphosphorylase